MFCRPSRSPCTLKSIRSTAKLTNVKHLIPVLMTLCLESYYSTQTFKIQNTFLLLRHRHVTCTLQWGLCVWGWGGGGGGGGWGVGRELTHPTQGLGKLERACSIHDVSQACAERVRIVFDALVAHVIRSIWGIRPSS